MFRDLRQASQGIVNLAENGVHAGHVIENGRFFRVDGQRLSSPVIAFLVLTKVREESSAQVERPRIVRVILVVFLGQLERAFFRSSRIRLAA